MKTETKGSSVFKHIFTTFCMAAMLLGSTISSAATSITALATPASAAAPASVTLSVTINADPDPVIITQIEYFNGIAPLGVATSAPFSLALANVAAGTYNIVAKASVDNPGNPVLVSEPTTLTVTGSASGGANVYYIQTDQLNTPRVITDRANALVWKWDSDPFGMLPPNEAPVSSTRFTFNPRFPGQYFDKESNLHYNYFRDYDPQLGRYVQSDPIGLAGGINTFGYVGGSPLAFSDPQGLNPAAAGVCLIPGVGWGGCAVAAVAVGGAIWWQQTHPIAAAGKPPRVEHPDAAAEHQAYKDAYKQPPPPFSDDCEKLKWQLMREKTLLAARMTWDAKWGNHHPEAIAQSSNAIRNIENKMKNAGCQCP